MVIPLFFKNDAKSTLGCIAPPVVVSCSIMMEGPKVQRYGRHEGAKARRSEGTRVRRYKGTKVGRYEGTKVRRYKGTKLRRDEGPKVRGTRQELSKS